MDIEIKRLSNGPLNHFFGYYGINPWDRTERYHLALETDFHDRRPCRNDIAKVGLVDSQTGAFLPYAQTSAFNLQQGAMLSWIDAGYGDEFTFNFIEEDGSLVSKAINAQTHAERTIEGAISAVSTAKPIAASLNYIRNFKCRKVVGYDIGQNESDIDWYPNDEGIGIIDLKTGKKKLILSVRDVVEANPMPQTKLGPAWLDHVVFNPSGTHLFFMCRIKMPDRRFLSSVWTAAVDGAELRCHVDYRYHSSHFDWRDDDRILLSSQVLGPMRFVEFNRHGGEIQPFGGDVLPKDGHACYSPDRRWILSDCGSETGGERRAKELFLYHVASGRKISLGTFGFDAKFVNDIRCDLHPRWNRAGTIVTFDSVHRGDRQIYLADVSDIVR